jgi:phosphoglycolate phosphatase-like HAD superfamily hydrolase
MAARRLRAIVLDFDGVIVESNDVKTEAFREVFARFPEHADAMMAFHHDNVSLSRYAKFEHLLEMLGRPGDERLRSELAADFSSRTLEHIAAVPLVAGAEAFLRKMSPRVPLYLASVTPQEDLDVILERRGLRSRFRAVYGCPPWTKPEAVRDALNREGCAPGEALLIGDSEGDQRAATETGVEFIARDSGLRFDTQPGVVFRDLTAIASHIQDRLQ